MGHFDIIRWKLPSDHVKVNFGKALLLLRDGGSNPLLLFSRRGRRLLRLHEQPSVGGVSLRGLRHPLSGDAHHQRPAVLGHDLLLRQGLRRRRLHRQGAVHHRGVRSLLQIVARVTIRLKVHLVYTSSVSQK